LAEVDLQGIFKGF